MGNIIRIPDYIAGFDLESCSFKVSTSDMCQKNQEFLDSLPYPADFDIITPEGSLHEKDQEEKLYDWGLTHYKTGIYFCLTHSGNTVNDMTVVLKIIDQLVSGEATFVRL